MDQLIYNVTSIISTVLIIATIIGGFLATRNGMLKATSEIQKNAGDYQAQAITALQAELALLKAKYEDIHSENVKLQQTITTICEALKSKGIAITVDGTMVTMVQQDSGSTTIARIHEAHDNGGVGFISQVNSAPGLSTSQILRKPGPDSILFKNQSTQIIEESSLQYQPVEQEQSREQVV